MSCPYGIRDSNPRFSPVWLAPVGVPFFIGTGGENTIEPYGETASYSVLGFVNLGRQRQFIRDQTGEAPSSPLGKIEIDEPPECDRGLRIEDPPS